MIRFSRHTGLNGDHWFTVTAAGLPFGHLNREDGVWVYSGTLPGRPCGRLEISAGVGSDRTIKGRIRRELVRIARRDGALNGGPWSAWGRLARASSAVD